MPHFAKGMIGELTVVDDEGDAVVPEADAAYSLPDNAEPEGATTLAAGEVTLEVTNDGEIGKDFIVAQLDDGKTIADFDTFFSEAFEGDGPPEKGVAEQAPGTIAGSTFEIAPGQTIYLTVTLTPGDWTIVNTTNVESEDDDAAEDHVLLVTVE